MASREGQEPRATHQVGNERTTAAPPKRLHWLDLLPSLVFASLYAVLASQPNMGVLVLSLLALVPWGIYSLGVVLFSPARRKLQAAKLVIWAAAFSVADWRLTVVDEQAEAAAQRAVQAIEAHMRRTGACPKSLEEAGYSTPAYQAGVGRLSAYYCTDGSPSLFYADPTMIYAKRHYSFEKRIWEIVD